MRVNCHIHESSESVFLYEEDGMLLPDSLDDIDGDESVLISDTFPVGGCGHLPWTKRFLSEHVDHRIVHRV
jgi:hypothetical protein